MIVYALTALATVVQRSNADGSLTFIPIGHPEFVSFQQWQAFGNVPAPYVAPPVPAPVISNPDVQALVAVLTAKGVLTSNDVKAINSDLQSTSPAIPLA
jgi:hypothetical protein